MLKESIQDAIREEFHYLDDGYKYYQCLSAPMLRAIADMLDADNKDWDEQVKADLEKRGDLDCAI